MKRRIGWLSGRKYTRFLVILLGLFWLVFSSLVTAQTSPSSPKSEASQITATVTVRTPPPVPILISPGNDTVLRQREVTFRWKFQEHILPYDYADLNIDGVTYLPHLPLYDQETDEYVLTVEYNSADSTWDYILKLKAETALNDGLHTWKVRAIDTLDHGTDSTTWSFTLDSQAPIILVTQINQTEVAISSADQTTIPSEPVVVSTKTPYLEGKTEANLTVQLTIVYADGTEVVQSTTSDENGVFAFTLPELLPNEVVTLRLSTVDTSGNTTVLDGLQLQYVPKKVVIQLPGVFPDPLSIELPSFSTPVTWSRIIPPAITQVVEPVVEPVLQPTRQFSNLIATIVETYTGLLVGLVLTFAGLYLVLLYWLTGNIWRFFIRFAQKWAKAWIFGWPGYQHLWREDHGKASLPLFCFSLERYDQDTKTVVAETRLTTLHGEWSYAPQDEQLYGVSVRNRRYVYPSWEVGVSEERIGTERKLYLTGENWYVASPKQQQSLVTSAESFVFASDKKYQLIVWGHQVAIPRWSGLRFVPRLSLLLSVLLALVILVVIPAWWSSLLFLLLSGILLRDLQWRVPQHWKVYCV